MFLLFIPLHLIFSLDLEANITCEVPETLLRNKQCFDILHDESQKSVLQTPRTEDSHVEDSKDDLGKDGECPIKTTHDLPGSEKRLRRKSKDINVVTELNGGGADLEGETLASEKRITEKSALTNEDAEIQEDSEIVSEGDDIQILFKTPATEQKFMQKSIFTNVAENGSKKVAKESLPTPFATPASEERPISKSTPAENLQGAHGDIKKAKGETIQNLFNTPVMEKDVFRKSISQFAVAEGKDEIEEVGEVLQTLFKTPATQEENVRNTTDGSILKEMKSPTEKLPGELFMEMEGIGDEGKSLVANAITDVEINVTQIEGEVMQTLFKTPVATQKVTRKSNVETSIVGVDDHTEDEVGESMQTLFKTPVTEK